MAAKMKMVESLKRVRRARCPLVAVTTADPAATIVKAAQAVKADSPRVIWDCVRNTRPADAENELDVAAAQELERVLGDSTAGDVCRFLAAMQGAPKNTIAFLIGGDEKFRPGTVEYDPAATQALWNLRDVLKSGDSNATLVFVGPSFQFHQILDGDIVFLDDDLPNAEELEDELKVLDENATMCGRCGGTGRVNGQRCGECKGSGKSVHKPLTPDVRRRAVEAALGVKMFAAENSFAMSLTEDGIDLDALWEMKRKEIEKTKGLGVWRGGETFETVKGLTNVKSFMRQINSTERPNGVVWLDEVEKGMAAGVSGGDNTGVSQGFLQSLLEYMEDHNSSGVIFLGPPGAGKSMVAKATGADIGVPTIRLDINGLKGQFVGNSEQAMRTALKVISSVTNDKALWIATCNGIQNLPPEFQSRFDLGVFFFDLPTREEKDSMWDYYIADRNLSKEQAKRRPSDEGWVGREIRNCCRIARRAGVNLMEAATFIIPKAVSAGDKIERLRREADGKYTAASYSGPYRYAARPDAVRTEPSDNGKPPRRRVAVK